MATIAILGAGIGGLSQAYELRKALDPSHRIVVINDSEHFEFTPSNPWVAVGWRQHKDITLELPPLMKKHDLDFIASAATRLRPADNAIDLANGDQVDYDYLVIATGPRLAFNEIPGFGDGYTQSICKTGHATAAAVDFEALATDPGPIVIGAAQGASCFGPAYEYAFIVDTELRKRKLRDRVEMTFVTPEPYIGHLGLDGVGDTKGLMESELRQRHIKWITNAKIDEIRDAEMDVTEVNEAGEPHKAHTLGFRHAMILPAFTGIDALRNVEGLVNPRGFVLIDKHQRNPAFPNIYSVGVCVAIPPVATTPVPVGTPKTGYMIESMVTATTGNLVAAIEGREPAQRATWNALCLADFGDSGVAFVALPQIPPRNTNWAARGKWVHLAKVGFEKYFLRKMRRGNTEPYFETAVLKLLGIDKLKDAK